MPRSPWKIAAYRLCLLALPALATLAPSATAAGPGYDVLIVACDEAACRRVAEQTLAAGAGDLTEYRHDGMKLRIEALARRLDAVDARISFDVTPVTAAAAIARGGARGTPQQVHVNVEPCTLKPGAFSTVAAIVSAGIIYRIWARLTAVR